MNHSITFQFRIWVRQWFFPPFAGWQTAVYNYKSDRKECVGSEYLERLFIEEENQKEP
ncbi:MAG: hypothetical protein AAB338_00225 [Patescibacteria group bacterium]